MGHMKEAWEDLNTQAGQDRANEFAFDLTMAILERGKKDVLAQLEGLRSHREMYAEIAVSTLNFKSDVEREIAKDCAKAAFLASIEGFKAICENVLRADYVG